MKNQELLINKIEEATSKIKYPSQPAGLFAPIEYILSLGGKRIRPLLTLMACELYSPNTDEAIDPAIGLEIFHNFTLLHDDLMDKADMRRGKQTVHIKWDDNTAILSGDAMQIMAYQYIARTPADKLAKVLDLFSKTALEICEGQQYDMEFESRNDVTEEEYIEMIRLKTAVLLGCALKIGALIGGANEEDAELLYKFGENIGLAFQLKDDLLDVFGDPAKFGKKIGGDIINNKKTFLLINAINNSDNAQKAIFEKWMNMSEFDNKTKIDVFTNLYCQTKAKENCEKLMVMYFNKGMEYFDMVNVDEAQKTELRELTKQLMDREK